jgi:peptidoglycan/LPS O-acetylase OafA/YrhL
LIFVLLVGTAVACPLSATTVGGVSVFTYLPFFVAGMLASHLQAVIATRAAGAVAIALLVFLVLLAVSPPGYQILLGGTTALPEYLEYNWVLQIAVAVFSIPLLIWSLRRKGGSLDHMFGDLSYIVYLVHSVVLSIVWRMFPQLQSNGYESRLVIILLAFAAVIASSMVLWVAVDRPSNRRRAAFIKSRIPSEPCLTQSPSVLVS